MPGKGQHSAARVAFHAAGGRGGGMARAFGGKRAGGHQARGHSGAEDGFNPACEACGIGRGWSALGVDLEAGSAAFFLSFCFRAAVASYRFEVGVGRLWRLAAGSPGSDFGHAGLLDFELAGRVPELGVTARATRRACGLVGLPRISAPQTEAVFGGHVGGRRSGLSVPLPAMAGRASGRDCNSRGPSMPALHATECTHAVTSESNILPERRCASLFIRYQQPRARMRPSRARVFHLQKRGEATGGRIECILYGKWN